MKRSKREENAILINLVFYTILLVISITYVLLNLLPQIQSLEVDKKESKDLKINLERIEKYGLSFEEFISINNKGKQNIVINEIMKNMSEDFYSTHLTNKSESNYINFLNNKKKEINNKNKKFIIEEKLKQIEKLLPTYTQEGINIGENVLTDYKFINYVESIVESFNLSTKDPIGISKLILLEDFVVGEVDPVPLDSNLFYIPLNLVLKGNKDSIIKFLYFIENVGNIKVSDNNIYLNTNDGFLSKNGVKKVLEGAEYSANYNIFENQIIDIDKIIIKEYIDGSYNSRGDLSFKDFILKNQGNDEFEISVNLMFYVKGQPNYKIKEFINNVFDKHKKLAGLINIALKDTNLKGVKRIKMSKYNNTIKQLNKEVILLRKNLSKKENLEEIYKRAVKINGIIDPILISFNK